MLRIFNSEQEVANEVAAEMNHFLNHDSNPVFCLASGSTPKQSYLKFADKMDKNMQKKLKIVSLDEWVGIPGSSEGSCYAMLHQDLFSPLQLKSEQIRFFNGTSSDLQEECLAIDRFLDNHPITFSLMGVGMNGHIGLNEPGCHVFNHSSVIKLSETTRKVAQKYFDQPTDLEEGITLGLGQIIKSKRVIVVMTGEHKAEIVREIFLHKEARLPAQALLGYEHIDFFLDSEAAKYIQGKDIEVPGS